MSEEKKIEYVDSVSFKEFTYESGGASIAMGVNVQKFIEHIKSLENEKGFANFTISRMKKPSEWGQTLHDCL